jgi:hypothetical protein
MISLRTGAGRRQGRQIGMLFALRGTDLVMTQNDNQRLIIHKRPSTGYRSCSTSPATCKIALLIFLLIT